MAEPSLASEFECAICCDVVTNARTGRCGHTYCFHCIDEWLAREKRCPCCNVAMDRPDLFENRVLDRVVERFKASRDASLQHMFTQLMHSDSRPGEDAHPVAAVFARCTGPVILHFREYHDRALAAASSDDQRRAVSAAVCEALEAHLRSLPRSSISISVTATLRVGPHLLPGVRIHPSTTVEDLVAHAKVAVRSAGDRLLRADDDVGLVLEGGGADGADCEPLSAWPARGAVVAQLRGRLVPGATLRLAGNFELESQRPKLCYSLEFSPATAAPMTYYRCSTCNLNWVCPNCATTCHVGHSVSVHATGHTPTYACCYCSRKSGCKLPNVRQPGPGAAGAAAGAGDASAAAR